MSAYYRKVAQSRADMTSLQGTVESSYKELTAIFGKHNSSGDDYKVSTEWVLEFEDGAVATIYDWKSTNLYDSHYLTVTALRALDSYHWHIGGKTRAVVGRVTEIIRQAREAQDNG